jgi:hypothetical protein
MSPSILTTEKSHDGVGISCIDRPLEDYTYMLSRANQNLEHCRYTGGATWRPVLSRSDRIHHDLICNCGRLAEVWQR